MLYGLITVLSQLSKWQKVKEKETRERRTQYQPSR